MIALPFAAGQTYFILGFGKSGKASAAALQASGARVIVWDDKELGRRESEAAGYSLADPVNTDWTTIKALVMAPGIPLTHPVPHPAVLKAKEAGVPVISDLDLLFEACPAATYVGITGTNGKSTTTALIAHILKAAARRVQMGGNIGTAALSLEPMGREGIYVLELSSYQLDLIHRHPLSVAVLLNITPDHYERHGGLSGYIEAKTKIAQKEAPQTLILGTDEPETKTLFQSLKTRPNLTLVELSSQKEVENGIKFTQQKLYVMNDPQPIDLSPLKSLPGLHNAQNAAAAFAACRALGLARDEMISGLASFPGLAHRQQFVAAIDGVRFINDSKATNADAAAKALSCYQNIYWIIGGQPKEGGLAGLESLMSHVAHAFLIGQASQAFAEWCSTNKVPFSRCETLDVATQESAVMAWNERKTDPVVLLSPACASWDQFTSFEHRGEAFASLVHALKKDC